MTRWHKTTNWKQADILAQNQSMLLGDTIWPFRQCDWSILGIVLIDIVLKSDLQLLNTLDIGNVFLVSGHRCLFLIIRLLVLHYILKFSWHNQKHLVICPGSLMLKMCSYLILFRNGNTCTHPVYSQKSGNIWKCLEVQSIGWELEMPQSSSIMNSIW